MAEDRPELQKMKEHQKNIVEKDIMQRPDKDPGGGKQWEKEHPKGPF